MAGIVLISEEYKGCLIEIHKNPQTEFFYAVFHYIKYGRCNRQSGESYETKTIDCETIEDAFEMAYFLINEPEINFNENEK